MSKVEVSRNQGSYWDGYYRENRVPELPSQFALFVANELATGMLPEVSGILDLGCGNGRDSVFFAGLGHAVAGLDSSVDAIARCESRAGSLPGDQPRKARFGAGLADSETLDQLANGFAGPMLVYSRFFFHAIDDETEQRVLTRLGNLLRDRGGALAVEYRTLADETGVRETGAHYRRYVDPDRFAARLAENGLELLWRAEGRGMAKYKHDDAHVARMIARPW